MTDVENVQDRAIGCRLARAAGHCLRQQSFQLPQVVELCSNVFEVARGDLADFATRCLLRPAESQQSADFIKRKA